MTSRTGDFIVTSGNLGNDDIVYWGGLPAWSVDEATALSLGKCGEIDVTSAPRLGLDRRDAIRRRHQIDLAVKQGELAAPIRPYDFLSWAHRKGIEVHPDLVSVIESQRQPGHEDGWEAECRRLTARIRELESERTRLREAAAAPDNPRAIASLEVIALCMAIDKFGYMPDAIRQPSATRLIVSAIERCGLKLTEETVLARLKAAKRHLQT